jgi:hypothetical protein
VEVAAHSGDSGKSGAAIPAQNNRKRARFHRNLDARPQGFERFHHARKISGSRAFFIRLGKLDGIVAVIDYFESSSAEPIGDAGGAKSFGSTFVSRRKCGRAGGCAQQRNFVRLASDLDGHVEAPWDLVQPTR